MGSCTATVPGTAGGPTVAIVGHIDEIGLVVTHIDDKGFLRFTGVGGWDPQVLVGQRVERHDARGRRAGRRRQQADPPARARGPQEGGRARGAAHRHRRQGRRRRARARAHRRRRGDRGRAGRAAQRPRRLALDGQPPRVLRRARGGAAGRRGRRRARRRRRRRRGAGETTFGGSRDVPYALAPDVAIVVDVTHETDAPGVESTRWGRTRSARAPIIERGSKLNPPSSSCCYEAAEPEGIPFTGRRPRPADGDRRRRDAPLARGHPARLVGLPLRYMHSAGRDGPARRHRTRRRS